MSADENYCSDDGDITSDVSDKEIEELEQYNEEDACITPEEAEEYAKKMQNTGVLYLSKIPPFMKPQKLKSLLCKYGEIHRVYLVPEDPKISARRKRFKNNKRKNYVEGWVEFWDKKVAKDVAKHLNNQIIGGSKRNYYHDDIWNIKYLPKFKWQMLTEQLAYEKAIKEQRLRVEMSQARREASQYAYQVEKSKRKNQKAQSFEFRQRKAKEFGETQTNPALLELF